MTWSMNNSFEGAAVAAARLRKMTAEDRFFIMINIVWLLEFFVAWCTYFVFVSCILSYEGLRILPYVQEQE